MTQKTGILSKWIPISLIGIFVTLMATAYIMMLDYQKEARHFEPALAKLRELEKEVNLRLNGSITTTKNLVNPLQTSITSDIEIYSAPNYHIFQTDSGLRLEFMSSSPLSGLDIYFLYKAAKPEDYLKSKNPPSYIIGHNKKEIIIPMNCFYDTRNMNISLIKRYAIETAAINCRFNTKEEKNKWLTDSRNNITALKNLLKREERDLYWQTNNRIKDCEDCPEMTFLPLTYHSEVAKNGFITKTQFAISTYEITQKEWNTCVKEEACSTIEINTEDWDPEKPILGVSRDNVYEFIAWLNKKIKDPTIEGQYELPSNYEWRYAAGIYMNCTDDPGEFCESIPPYFSYQCFNANYAVFAKKSSDQNAFCSPIVDPKDAEGVSKVGKQKPNELGLYDLFGNVWEMCADGYINGGSWIDTVDMFNAHKTVTEADVDSAYIGFRVIKIFR